jgi:predicted DNA-binding transcriptional regulator YafY
MKDDIKGDQIGRVLQIYSKLLDGDIVNKAEEAARYGVNERSIQRDIDNIRNFLDEDSERTGIVNTVVYDRNEKGYRLETIYQMRLQNSEVLALCKILLDSRAFTKPEMTEMLDKLISCCVPMVN